MKYYKSDDCAAAKIYYMGGSLSGWVVIALYSDGQLAYHWNKLSAHKEALAKLKNPVAITKEEFEKATNYRR